MDRSERKFAWVDELVKKTGEVAMEEARKHNTYIVYTQNDGRTVREYPDGRVEVIRGNGVKMMKQIHNQIPLPEHLSWKFSSIVEVMENWRVIHALLAKGYQKEEIKPLFPALET